MNAYVKLPVGLSSRTVAAKEAIEQGSTPGFLLTIANSLERLGRQYNSTPYEDKEERRSMRLQADENFKQATHLRRVVRDVRRMWKDTPDVAMAEKSA